MRRMKCRPLWLHYVEFLPDIFALWDLIGLLLESGVISTIEQYKGDRNGHTSAIHPSQKNFIQMHLHLPNSLFHTDRTDRIMMPGHVIFYISYIPRF